MYRNMAETNKKHTITFVTTPDGGAYLKGYEQEESTITGNPEAELLVNQPDANNPKNFSVAKSDDEIKASLASLQPQGLFGGKRRTKHARSSKRKGKSRKHRSSRK